MQALPTNQYLISEYINSCLSNLITLLNHTQTLRHTIYSKNKRVVIPLIGGKTANHQGGFFMPVTFGGLVECLQKYKTTSVGIRISSYQLSDHSTRQFICYVKNLIGNYQMIASLPLVGALRPMVARTRTVKKKELSQTLHHSPITFKTYTDGNTVAFQNKKPIAWIVQGIHHGQVDNQPYTCTYFDVAFIQQSRHTYFLDSSPEFDTEQQARDFITSYFEAEVVA